MDLKLNDEQQALGEVLRDFLEAHHSTDVVRALEDDPTGYRAEVWQGLAQMDLIGLTIPPEYGGSGMGPIEQAVLYQELGRALTNVPHLVSAVLAAGLLLESGQGEAQRSWLPRIANGDAIVTVAWHEPGGGDGEPGIRLSASDDGVDIVLSGTKIRVPYASAADALIVVARTRHDSVDLVLVPSDAAGLTLAHTPVMSSEAEYEVTFDGVRIPASAKLSAGVNGWQMLERRLLDVLLAVAAYALGGARRSLEMTIEYAKERVQFGRPIGSFQGLSHPVADLAAELEGAEVLLYQAAWRRSSGEESSALVHMAKANACDVYKRMTKQAQQVFGGIGFTRAIDVQLFTRRAKQLEISWGGPGRMLEAIAAVELDGDPIVGIPSAV